MLQQHRCYSILTMPNTQHWATRFVSRDTSILLLAERLKVRLHFYLWVADHSRARWRLRVNEAYYVGSTLGYGAASSLTRSTSMPLVTNFGQS